MDRKSINGLPIHVKCYALVVTAAAGAQQLAI